ncbi:MAG TPA: malto-oligosyltrehalose trehalohydrolase [Pseudonocardiaceae bacterium]|nr:malto-oligosyltrehalose trehalohydrolase [Pseudonocardiaceae bacterium]
MRFSVWAPGRERVRLRIGTADTVDHELRRSAGGWWVADVQAGHGTDYAFVLDDGEPLPDPRSRWQPNGVRRPSRVYDHARFEWTDDGWTGRPLAGGVIYELHVGTFTPQGTFDSALRRLDHLVDLGVDFVEVMPVNAVDAPRNWGYDGVLWFAVTENYGGPDAFKRFVDGCHRRGLAVLLDVVHNHLGPSGAYLDRFGPYFAGRNIWGPSLNLDGPDSDEVRRFLIDNALGWLRDFHLDGLRLDAVHALVDRRATHVLEELATEADALAAHLRRPLSLIAESDLNDPRLVTAWESGGYGLTAQWNDDVHHCLHAALTGERQGYYADFGALTDLRRTLREVFFHAGHQSSFRRRTHGRPVDVYHTPAHRFVVSLQNHDQIGNRATGDRLPASLPPGLLACGAALLLCSPYTPMLFMGEEWGASTPFQFFSYFPDPRLRERIRLGRYEEFAEHGWDGDVPDPNDEATFERSKLRWDEVTGAPHARLLSCYRALIALRRARPELTDPWLARLRVDVDEDARWIVLHRGPAGTVVLAVNLAGDPAKIPLATVDTANARVLLDWEPARLHPDAVELPAESFAVLDLGGCAG